MADSKGEYHQGEIGLDGTYRVSNVLTGPVKIGVTSPNPEGRGRGGETRGPRRSIPTIPREKFKATQEKTPERPLPPPGSWFPLPRTAGDPSTSGLKAEGTGKPIDIDVK